MNLIIIHFVYISTYEINHESVEETVSEDVQHDLYEIDDSQEMEDNTEIKSCGQEKDNSAQSADSTSHEFQCENCGLAFKDVSALKTHLKTHGTVRRHECGDCKKNFKTRLSLTIHMRSHTGERPYVCEVCIVCLSINTNSFKIPNQTFFIEHFRHAEKRLKRSAL